MLGGAPVRMKKNKPDQYTIFNTPIIRVFFRGLSLLLMKLTGWKKSGTLPDVPRYIIVVAPHTSNWDLFYGIIVAFSLGLDGRFMAKRELFHWPFGPVMKWLGGMPIDRSSHENTVDQVIRIFGEGGRLALAIAPEGTRSRTKYWKSGFYHIAVGAGVPIQLGYLDYRSKTGGAGPLIVPTGNIDDDMAAIGNFYRGVSGRYADKAGPVSLAGHTINS
jgi:1-acyl-sn-glycerol-3-phosphate acyltransferase